MADGEPVLETFEAEVRERDAIWKAPPGQAPRLRVQKHRGDTPATRVLIRSNGYVLPLKNGESEPMRVRAVTVHFTDEEWSLIERAVLAGLGLGRIG